MLLAQGRVPTLNGSRYLLTEFAMDADETVFLPALQEIMRNGYIPLVAHPERYVAVARHPHIVEEWLDCDCHVQITGGSILGAYGKTVQRTAHTLLQRDLVACVASDAHGIHGRSNYLLDVYDHLFVQYSKSYANCLMYTNPLRILEDESL